MTVSAIYIAYAIALVVLGWIGIGIINLNSKRHFLSKQGYTFLCIVSFVFNIVGSFYCIRGLFM